jgi:hypothetical protein
MVAVPITVDQPPFILTKPELTIGPAGAEVTYQCGANEIDASPEQDSNDVETFCGVFTSYKPAKWTVTITALQSFGADGLWNALRPFVNTIQPFLIVPDSTQPVSESNVAMSGEAFVPEFAYITAAVGEASEFDFVLAVQGDPDWLVVPPVARTTPEGTPQQQSASAKAPTTPAA